MENPDEQSIFTKKREKKKKTYSQTSQLENPEELQLHHYYEKIPFF
jgi:hypothetical protein